MLPLAPVRFSTTTGCPHVSFSFGASTRAVRSLPPPAAKPTMILTGFAGYVCACASAVRVANSTPPTISIRIAWPPRSLEEFEQQPVHRRRRLILHPMAGIGNHLETHVRAQAAARNQ